MAALLRRTRGGEFSTPKTVLGFYAGVMAIVELGVVGVITVLATNDSLRYLVPWTLLFAALVLVALIGIVVAMNIRDPSKLQLGQMTGREFIDYQRLTLGDSVSGEYTEEVSGRHSVLLGESPKVLGAKSDQENEEASEVEK